MREIGDFLSLDKPFGVVNSKSISENCNGIACHQIQRKNFSLKKTPVFVVFDKKKLVKNVCYNAIEDHKGSISNCFN